MTLPSRPYSMRFRGAEYLDLNIKDIGSQYTWEFWFKTNNPTHMSIGGSVSNMVFRTDVHYQHEGNTVFYHNTGDSDNSIRVYTDSMGFADNRWRKVIYRYDNMSSNLWIDGELIETSQRGNVPQHTLFDEPIYLGALNYQGTPMYHFDGHIAYPAFWYSARDVSDIESNWNKMSDADVLWTFTEGEGNTATSNNNIVANINGDNMWSTDLPEITP